MQPGEPHHNSIVAVPTVHSQEGSVADLPLLTA